MSSRTKYAVVFSSTFLVLLLIIGNVMGNSDDAASENSPSSVYRHLSVYTEVLSRIKTDYVEEPDMKLVTLGAVNGLLESVDPFASYLNADQYKQYLKDYDTYRGDAGLVLSKKYGYVAVVDVIPGSPAAKAGLSTGDMIETIAGVATRDMPLAYASLLLRGPVGSTVELSVIKRKPEPEKVAITRAVVANPPLQAKIISNDIGYIRPDTLSGHKVEEIASAIKDLQAKGAKRFLLDLRSCGAGDVDAGIELANLFLSSGTITYAKGQRFPQQNYTADGKKQVTKLPLVVITNRGTASAAEVAAAALEGDKRADVVGDRTYGDASVRRTITMDDGSAVILSVAKFYGPDGKSIQDNGVTPTQQVAEPDASGDVDEDGEPVASAEDGAPSDDLLLKKAIDVVSKKS